MTPFHYLLLGYGIVWIILGFYLFGLNRKIAEVRSELAELKTRISRNGS